MRLTLYLTSIAILFFACTPELDDDQIKINFVNRSRYQYTTSDSGFVFAKISYSANTSRNDVHLNDSVYSSNVLVGNYGSWDLHYNFGDDSALFFIKQVFDTLYFRNRYINGSSDRFGDSLYKLNIKVPGICDTLYKDNFDSIEFAIQVELTGIDSTDLTNINSRNTSISVYSRWYKTYKQWQDEIISLYR